MVTGKHTSGTSPSMALQAPLEEHAHAHAFALWPNQPNPFKASTTIRFDLPAPRPVQLEIFDMQGRRVATVADRMFPAGSHAVRWDRRASGGELVQPGLYVYRVRAGEFHDSKKLVVLP